MAFFAGDRIKITSTTSGTASFGCGAATSAAFHSFTSGAVPDGSTNHYAAFTATEFECGQGVFDVAGNTLSRVTIYASSAALNAKVNFGSNPTVFLGPLAESVVLKYAPILGATVVPETSDGAAIGTTTLMFSDLFLASGAVINFNNGNVTLTHSAGALTSNVPLTANSFIPSSSSVPTNGMYLPAANTLGFSVNSTGEVQLTLTALSPITTDSSALGTSSLMWSDLFLASGAVVNFNASDMTLTHSAGILEIGNAAAGAEGPYLSFYQNSASPAVDDAIARLQFYGTDSGAAKQQYADINVRIKQTTAASEIGYISGQTMLKGTMTDSLLSEKTFMIGYNSAGATTNYEYVWRGPSGYQTYQYLESFDGGTQGPQLNMWHNSPSPAVSDDVASIGFDGMDSGAAYQSYARIYAHVSSVTAGSEECLLAFQTPNPAGGALRDIFYAAQGVVVGSPTGGDKGLGALNATAVYDDNVLLTCYPWEAAKTGKVDLDYWDGKVHDTVMPAKLKKRVIKEAVTEPVLDKNGRSVLDDNRRPKLKLIEPAIIEYDEAEPAQVIEKVHLGARKFSERLGTPYDPTTIAGQRKHQNDKAHLTPYPNPDKYSEENRPSVGGWVQRGIEMDELLFLYISQLEERTAALENH